MKRLNNLSIYRIIATICVLTFHIFYLLYDRAIPYELLLSKGVQGLTALSGFLYSQKLIKDCKKFYWTNFKKIIIPATVCILFMVTWDVIYMLITKNYDYMQLLFMHRPYNNGLVVQPGNYYYLLYIFICYLITPVLQRNDKWSVLVVVVAVVAELSIRFFFGPAIIICSYIAGYYIGRKWFKTYTDVETKYNPGVLFLWIGVLALSIGLYVLLNVHPIMGNYFLTHLHSLTINILKTIFGVATFFFIAYLFRFTNKYKGFKLFVYTDKLALIIYLMNQAFMCGAMDVTHWVEPMWAKWILVYVFTLVASVGLWLINEQINKLAFKQKLPQIEAKS